MNKIIMCLLLQIISLLAFGQNRVSGTVSDINGQGIPGVTVLEKGTKNGTITDTNGKFSITVNEYATLSFSYTGFKKEQINVEANTTINIELLEVTSELNELVVTALGIERETKDLGYVVQRIDSKKITDVKTPNFLNNLNGKLAGVTITQGATGVGSSSKIIIRGEASFTNNNPLFVVDGVPINNNTIVNFTNDAAAGFQEVDFGNGAMEVNPDDVASVSVLKGPSAAALYGTRASNGVIIIETKDGRDTHDLGVSINSTIMIDRAFRLPKFQNQYGQGNAGQFEYVDGLGAGVNDNISYSWGPRLDQGLLLPQFDSPVTLSDGSIVRGADIAVHGGSPISATPFVSHLDNLKDFYETGITTINNIAISSGFDKGSFRLSLTDLQSKSIIPGVNLDRRTVSTNLAFRPISKLKIASAISYINSQSDNRPSNGYGSENINYSLVAWGPRSLNINSLKEYWQPGLAGVEQYSFNYTFFDNPYFTLYENRNSFERDRLFGNISATYFITNELSIALRSGLDYSSEQRQFIRNFSSNRFQNGAYAVHDVYYREGNTDFLINYVRDFNDISFNVSFGGSKMDQEASTVQNQALSLAQPVIFRLTNAASPIQTFEFLSKKRINSLYGIFKMSFRDFLFFEATGRNDWSSALATPTSTDNTSFFYPSFSSAFVASDLIDLPDAIDFLKIRASWAQVGNDTNPYQTAGVFNAQTPHNGQPTFSDQARIPNSNLLPEITTAVELGGEVRLLKKISLDVTYYSSVTQNQIISLPVSITSGYNQQVVNGSEVRSKGIEVIAGINPINSSVIWNTQLNFSKNVTTIESLPDGVERLTLAYSRVYDNVNQTVFFQVEEGGRIGDMYGTGYLKNEDGDFVIGSNGLYVSDNTLKKLGNYNPDFMLGVYNTIQYKNWNLNFLIDWRKGGKLVSRTLALAAVGGQLEETAYRPSEGIIANGVVNIGTVDAPQYIANSQSVSAEAYYRNYYDRNHEENNTYDASYVKLRELSLTYSFSKGMFKGPASLDVSLIGRNLFVITNIPHFDPETLAVQGQQFVNGVEDMSYATTRSYGIKLALNF